MLKGKYFIFMIQVFIIITTNIVKAQDAQMHIQTTEGTDVYSIDNVTSMTFVNRSEAEFELGNTGLMIEMVWINTGEFIMGAQENEEGAGPWEYPRHLVTISEGFWMSKYEITQQEWETVAGWENFAFDGNPYNPAENISWDDIHNDFIDNINADLEGNPWRLPSEAEWEYSYRSGTETRYYWGNDPDSTLIYDYAVFEDNSQNCTAEVGTKLPNAWGLYDMSGNVWEWCEDDFHFNYNGAPEDQNPWIDNPRSEFRSFRGGGWDTQSSWCKSSHRDGYYSYSRFESVGFRLVREAQ